MTTGKNESRIQLRAGVVAVGSELTSGKVADRHGSYLAGVLSRLGINVTEICQIADKVIDIQRALERLSGKSDLIIVTGGLGPTQDDLTRAALSAFAGEPLEFREELWDQVKRAFGGTKIAESNRRQAEAPRGFQAIPNDLGTAPGLVGRIESCTVIALPGPPRELIPMVESRVLPIISDDFELAPPEETLVGTSFLVPESVLEEALQTGADEQLSWSTRAEPGRIVFSLSGGEDYQRKICFDSLVTSLGKICVRSGECEAKELLFQELRERKKRIITAESCTGGLVAKQMTDLAGSSDFFWGALVTYADDAKMQLLGVAVDDDGAVSESVVRKMASRALKISDSDLAIAISGIAGPGGGSIEKPVGTVWIAVTARGSEMNGGAWKFGFSGSRERIRRHAAVAAILLAEVCVRGKEIDKGDMWGYI